MYEDVHVFDEDKACDEISAAIQRIIEALEEFNKAISENTLLSKIQRAEGLITPSPNLSHPQTVAAAYANDEKFLSPDELKKRIATARREMEKAARELDFLTAARWRDEIERLKSLLNEK